MSVCTTQILFSKSLTASHTKCMFPRNAIRVALLYSGFMLAGIQAFHIQKFSRISLGCIFLCFCMIRNLGSPTIYMHTIDTNAKHAISYMKQLDLAPLSSLARTEASCGRVHLTALGGIRELCTSHLNHRPPWGRGIAGLLIFQFPKPC